MTLFAVILCGIALMVSGGIVLLTCAGATLSWLRIWDKALRRRLQWVGAPLSGHGAAEELAQEESIFRPTERRSRLSWLWRLIEARYPLIDARRALPRVSAIGVLAAAGAWLAMSVLGMSGWWSMPVSGLAGVGGAWYALARLQNKLEGQFIQ